MNYKHGHAQKGQVSSEWRTWWGMKQRCQNTNVSCYHNYGGRGIKICQRWQSFEDFLEDMGLKSSADLTLERINNDGNYEPGNCKRATRSEQQNNKRPCVYPGQYWFKAFSPDDRQVISNNQREFTKQYGLNHRTISDCLNGKHKTHGGWRFKRL